MIQFGTVIEVYNLPNNLSDEHRQLALDSCHRLLSNAKDVYGISDEELNSKGAWQFFEGIEAAKGQDTVHFLVTTGPEVQQATALRNGSREEYLSKRVISKTINFTPWN
jgi:hypothetical protein